MLNGKLKRFMSTGVAAALSLAMLAGCGGNSGKNEASQVQLLLGRISQVYLRVETYENGLPKNEEVTLKVGFFVGGYGREWFDYAVESFTAKYPNVKVDITASADMKTILSTKSLRAMIMTCLIYLIRIQQEVSWGLLKPANLNQWMTFGNTLFQTCRTKGQGSYDAGHVRVNATDQWKRYEFTTASALAGCFNKSYSKSMAGTKTRTHGMNLKHF